MAIPAAWVPSPGTGRGSGQDRDIGDESLEFAVPGGTDRLLRVVQDREPPVSSAEVGFGHVVRWAGGLQFPHVPAVVRHHRRSPGRRFLIVAGEPQRERSGAAARTILNKGEQSCGFGQVPVRKSFRAPEYPVGTHHGRGAPQVEETEGVRLGIGTGGPAGPVRERVVGESEFTRPGESNDVEMMRIHAATVTAVPAWPVRYIPCGVFDGGRRCRWC